MAHKVHPKSFRIKGIADWNSRGFYKKNFPKYLEEDFNIREFLEKKLGKMGIEKIEIERFAGKTTIIIYSARPGLIIGRGGGGVEELRKEIMLDILKRGLRSVKKEEFLKQGKQELKIEIREVKDPWASAELSAQWIAQQIEKRVRFRRVLKQALDKIMAAKGVQGARVEVAGRLDGNEIARTEWLRKGRLPRNTLRSNIDFAGERAYCTYGVVGIKVWIYKGEKFE